MCVQCPLRGELSKVFHLVDKVAELCDLSGEPQSLRYWNGQWCRVVTRAGLEARRELARKLTPEKVKKLRGRLDINTPDYGLMQGLYDAGFETSIDSGQPVFDPSKCSEELKMAHWRALVLFTRAVESKSGADAKAAAAAFEELKARVLELGSSAARM